MPTLLVLGHLLRFLFGIDLVYFVVFQADAAKLAQSMATRANNTSPTKGLLTNPGNTTLGSVLFVWSILHTQQTTPLPSKNSPPAQATET